MVFELIFHYFTIIVHHDFTGAIKYVHEDSALLEPAYRIAGL